tara:strand:+ start:33 stop:200 length:168 start_codon:yes stop_codon:yes gene_type:complete
LCEYKNKRRIIATASSTPLDPVANIDINIIGDRNRKYFIFENNSIVKPGNNAMAK